MIKLNVSAANIAVEEKETLTEGRVGLLCQFSFAGEWDGLAKTAVFDGADSRDVILTEDTVAVPAECLAAEGYSLSVGVYGKNAAGDIVIPTVYATVGKIQRSAYPAGKEAAPPTPDVVAQIQQAAANAEAMARAVREDAELGKFNGEQGEPGGWYTPEIKQPIKKAMVVNFIPSKEGMPAAEPKLILLPEGEPGGWYTPAITQPDENTMRVSFTPSKEDMPEVPPKDIIIPTGGGSGGGITVDDTLTVSGAAADAKAVGEKINSLYEEMLTEESDPTVPAWAKAAQKPSYTAHEVGADPFGTADSKVSAHNTGTDSHGDIRLLIQGLTERLNALADSDDTTLDQMSEIVAYIKSNKSLIDAISTSKVSVADIIDNLTTNVSNKPLSAAQGVALKALIDALSSGKLDADKLTDAINTALAQAKASGEFDGADGKSAYAYAVEGGYDGTESEFANKLAAGVLIVTVTDNNGTLTADKTYLEIAMAIIAGTTVMVDYDDSVLPLIGVGIGFLHFGIIMCFNDDSGAMVGTSIIEITENDEVNDISAFIEKLPNPNALTFTGAVTGTYDGSAPITVEIPSGGGETADLPVLQSFTIEGDETNKIEFTDLPNLTEFEVELKWSWSTTSGNSTVSVWLEPGFGDYNNRVLNIANGLMRGSSMSLEIFGKRISNTMQNILVTGGPVGESVTADHNSQITAKKSVTYIGIQATTSGVYFVNGTTVTLRGR